MSAAHTPGPWQIRFAYKLRPDSPDIPRHILGADGKIVVTFNQANPRVGDEKRANARLIAAAPDLYEALENILSAMSPLKIAGKPLCGLDATLARRVTEAVQVVSKARGEQP